MICGVLKQHSTKAQWNLLKILSLFFIEFLLRSFSEERFYASRSSRFVNLSSKKRFPCKFMRNEGIDIEHSEDVPNIKRLSLLWPHKFHSERGGQERRELFHRLKTHICLFVYSDDVSSSSRGEELKANIELIFRQSSSKRPFASFSFSR